MFFAMAGGAETADDAVSSLAAIKHRADAALVLAAAHAEAADAPARCGMTLAQWLAWRCQLQSNEARRLARVAQDLGRWPLLLAAFDAGELSVATAAAALRVVTPETEAALLADARSLTANQFVRLCRTFARGATPPPSRPDEAERAEPDDSVDWWHDTETGRFHLRANLSTDKAQPVVAALEAAVEEVRSELDEGERSPRSELAADALARFAEAILAGGLRGGSGADRHQIIVHADLEALLGHVHGRAWTESGLPVSVATLARMACDTSLVTLITRNGETLALGRKSRTPNRAQRRAVAARDHGQCRWPGCGANRFTDVHHVVHWTDGGPTDLCNLVTLCWKHHHLLHDGPFTMTGDANGALTIRNTRWDTTLPATPPPGPAPPPRIIEDLPPPPETARPRWHGEKMTPYALDMLLQQLFEPLTVAA